MNTARKPYPSDLSDEERSLIVPYLLLMKEDAEQSHHDLQELFNGLRYVIRDSIAWRAMPNDLSPWSAVYQQSRRWMEARCFEALVHDLRAVLRLAAGKKAEPTTAIIDSRTLRSTPESGLRSAYDGAKRKNGSKLHMAVDTLGHLPALHITPANRDDRAETGPLAEAIRQATDGSVELAWADQGYIGSKAAKAAEEQGITLEIIRLPLAKRGFVLLPRRWIAERSFAWATRYRRLVKDYERCASTLAAMHTIAFAGFMLKNAANLLMQGA
ncbi:IS5 family transposase [Acetobacter fallax]|uniref:IS5 family transposase n=1 Tax=Acetobacter fallax TaxID=1737473 RepID=A0ABX0K544_9PROT|nr:IS5 family transposase [Acetobacter fallax]NHO31492.1 IS5 family transposase [Acetobacter fallax]NHO34924.1 IS5 family transposase [Acetobacter fallax]